MTFRIVDEVWSAEGFATAMIHTGSLYPEFCRLAMNKRDDSAFGFYIREFGIPAIAKDRPGLAMVITRENYESAVAMVAKHFRDHDAELQDEKTVSNIETEAIAYL